jgi:hypothetical protein
VRLGEGRARSAGGPAACGAWKGVCDAVAGAHEDDERVRERDRRATDKEKEVVAVELRLALA